MNLIEADLRGADFAGAALCQAGLAKAKLSGAYFGKAHFFRGKRVAGQEQANPWEEIEAMLAEAAPDVAVFHVADNPGRNDPGTGEINYTSVYKVIQKTGFSGYLTMEYLPLGDQVASLTKAVNDFRSALVSWSCQ